MYYGHTLVLAAENIFSVADVLTIQPQLYIRILTQAGYKEREDRIAELDEFINDQVVELDKMEAAMKQTVANKQAVETNLSNISRSKAILEKEHQKLMELFEQATVKLPWFD